MVFFCSINNSIFYRVLSPFSLRYSRKLSGFLPLVGKHSGGQNPSKIYNLLSFLPRAAPVATNISLLWSFYFLFPRILSVAIIPLIPLIEYFNEPGSQTSIHLPQFVQSPCNICPFLFPTKSNTCTSGHTIKQSLQAVHESLACLILSKLFGVDNA